MSKVGADINTIILGIILTFRKVLLQAMKEEPASDAKCKDKFLVQTVSVTRDMEFANVTSIVRLFRSIFTDHY
jgi:hypothetical protein